MSIRPGSACLPPPLKERNHTLTTISNHSNFKIFNVATNFTPAMVIENVLGGKAEPKGWAITEVVEKGDGAWAKVRSSNYCTPSIER